MEDYYHKVIKLQEMLRKSEEERLNLEIKFNETLQLIKQEEEVHLKRFRSKYRKFLDEDKRRQQRNYKILDALDRIENRTSMWETKTEKFRAMRKKYQSCINLPSTTKYHQDCKDISKPSDYSVAEKTVVLDKYMDDYSPQNFNSEDEKTIDNSSFLNKYSNLGNINSLYSKFSRHEKTDPEKVGSFDSTPLKTTKDYANILKQHSDSQDYSFNNRWNQNDTLEKPLTFINDGDNLRSNYFPEIKPLLKSPQTLIRLNQPEEREMVNKSFQESEIIKNCNEDEKFSSKYNVEEKTKEEKKFNDEKPPLMKNYDDVTFSKQGDFVGKISNDEFAQEDSDVRELIKREEVEIKKRPLQEYENKEEVQSGNKETLPQFNLTIDDVQRRDTAGQHLQKNDDRNEKVLQQNYNQQVTDVKKPLLQTNIENQRVLNDEISVKNEQECETKIQKSLEINEGYGQRPIQQGESMTKQYEEKLEPAIQQNGDSGQPIQMYEEIEEPEDLNLQYENSDKPIQQHEESEQLIQQFDENVKQDRENKQQPYHEKYERNEQQYNKNGQPIQQYDTKEQPYHKQYNEKVVQPVKQDDVSEKLIQQFDSNGQPDHQQYDKNEKPIQQYDANVHQTYPQQVDKNGQPIQQFDENGKVENGQPYRQQYDENKQLIQEFDENAKVIQQYDANGQQYDENGQLIQQFDENGKVIQQYDSNGQPYHQQYDTTAQPIQQYDENGQPIQQYYANGQQYDKNGQPIQQYDENGQPIQQYDANGQQYDENGQPIQQYDKNGQPIHQYDANGQPYHQQYDESGQPIQQYDENGQPIQQYDANGQPYHQQYDENGQPIQQYDENGQPIQQYDANGQPYHQQYDENGQPIQQYDENGQPYPQYDENGQLLQYYDENGQPAQQYEQYMQQYDENGQLLQYDESGQLVQHTNNTNEQSLQPNDAEKQILQEEPGKDQPKSNVLDILETDTESLKVESKVSNDSDFDISNISKN